MPCLPNLKREKNRASVRRTIEAADAKALPKVQHGVEKAEKAETNIDEYRDIRMWLSNITVNVRFI